MQARYLTLLIAPLFSTAVLATGYTGPGAQASNSVLAAQAAGDDAHVVLQGHITRKLGDEKYEFKDSTGTITVEIDDEDLPPVAFDDKTLVKLTGEVDKGLLQREVDVDRLEITQ
ncbi:MULTISPECIES: YgiW/YdeI family stress tolerance OB fold protein [Pseudomonadaceae]|uniref:YgiW/YdeI family stress tolerance OB fold protein n=1 Tax=Pseudomonadaceae TaxID=135621 RepID=UPI0007800FAB|nr:MULTISPECIES: NirD/YgiW/YdeI family stress tolerance protein [Pseudomonas]AMR65657.1 stress-induced protein YgiW [Pseudomonas alcaligenes]MDC7827209.1 NirD/YgiW/YdeI family stress tolerance protein [Pseudomonas sp. BLCC-B13]